MHACMYQHAGPGGAVMGGHSGVLVVILMLGQWMGWRGMTVITEREREGEEVVVVLYDIMGTIGRGVVISGVRFEGLVFMVGSVIELVGLGVGWSGWLVWLVGSMIG